MGGRMVGIFLVGLFLVGCASVEDLPQDHPKSNERPRGDRDPIDYHNRDTGNLQDRVAFFADLDQRMKTWEDAKNRSDHARERLQSEDPLLEETQHARFDLSGVACETFTFRRPTRGPGLATFVELFVFRRETVVFMVTLILPESLVRELRPDLLFSLSHLRVFE